MLYIYYTTYVWIITHTIYSVEYIVCACYVYNIQYSIFKVTEPDNLMAETMEYAQELAALPLSSLICNMPLLDMPKAIPLIVLLFEVVILSFNFFKLFVLS